MSCRSVKVFCCAILAARDVRDASLTLQRTERATAGPFARNTGTMPTEGFPPLVDMPRFGAESRKSATWTEDCLLDVEDSN